MCVYNGKYRILTLIESEVSQHTTPIDCACVIHGTGYTWQYVDNLYSMLSRNLSRPVQLHVYTEASRSVPAPYIKHELVDWAIAGPKLSWWYKIQLFNSEHHRGPLLYFDLDVVIAKNIDWMWHSKLQHFWAVKDFKHLWRPMYQSINSSIMWWDTTQFDCVWRNFLNLDLAQTVKRFRGDQDYLSSVITEQQRRYFNPEWVKSWRWQCLDGGYDFKRRSWLLPNTGTVINDSTTVMIFHGKPKPHEVHDAVIQQHWR